MHRILSLQGLVGTALSLEAVFSGESNHCSSATTACSTQSSQCVDNKGLFAW